MPIFFIVFRSLKWVPISSCWAIRWKSYQTLFPLPQTVGWDKLVCFSGGNCFRGLSNVFWARPEPTWVEHLTAGLQYLPTNVEQVWRRNALAYFAVGNKFYGHWTGKDCFYFVFISGKVAFLTRECLESRKWQIRINFKFFYLKTPKLG
jgi:hypothetical protein